MEENKLIAEFMGFLESSLENLYYTHKSLEGFGIGQLTELRYDTDWNWLMDVVDKIESLNFSVEMNRQEEGDYQCLIVKKEIIVQTFSSSKIESVYQSVVNFIKWYEQNNN